MIKDRKPYNLLVVEDNAGDFFLIQEYLHELILAPNIMRAKSFKEAQEILGNGHEIDAILLDLSLPDLEGESLIKETIAHAQSLPVIILTGHTDLEFSIRSLSMGASDYLLKDELNALILYKSLVYSIERQKSLIDIKQSEQRYSDLFHLSPHPMWVYDAETLKFIDVNEAAILHYGYSNEEFLSMTIKDIRPEEDVPRLMEVINRPDRDSSRFHGEFRHRKKNGEIIFVDLRSNTFFHNGRKAKIILALDITEKREAQQELMIITQKVEDQERKRISLNIHDGLQQTLVASFMQFDSLQKNLHQLDESNQNRFKKGFQILQMGIKQARSIAHELMPKVIEDLGYVMAINELLDQYDGVIDFTFTHNLDDHRLPQHIELILFRISQEAINNIIKHSKATEAQISLYSFDGLATLSITDNGVGFKVEMEDGKQKAFGLKSVESRIRSTGGSLNIQSSSEGTVMDIVVPIY